MDFRYGSRKVLNQITFTLSPNQVTCIQGPNGAGKTTLANLFLGFYRPDRGQILADGYPYDKLDMAHLRSFIGVVQQDPIIFPGTIYDNITYGYSRVKKEKLQKILDLTLCAEFVDRLPNGLSTPITGKGYSLSGGEIQRIALVRALLGDHTLLIMDEPSSHLEYEVIKKIIRNIKELKPCPTVFLISLDQQVACLADSVVYLKNGKINWRKTTGMN